MKRDLRVIIAMLLACIFIVSAFCSCKLTPGSSDEVKPTGEAGDPGATDAPEKTDPPYGVIENPSGEYNSLTVVMRSRNHEITLFDFGQSFYSSRKLQYYMYGMLTAEQYCESVVDEVATLLYLLEAAHDRGIEMNEEDLAEADRILEKQLEQLLTRYEQDVEEGVEDKRAAAMKMLEDDLKDDGLDFDSFKELSRGNICMYNLADKLYQTLDDDITVSEDEVREYAEKICEESATLSIADFVQAFSTYNEGNGPLPAVVPDDCFSVNHIFLGFKSVTDDDGNSHMDNESRREDEAKLEKLIGEAADFDAFMELESEYGEDPGMDNERFRKNGYIIHPDLVSNYYPGFVYAAMNLHEGSWTPSIDLQSDEDIDYGVRDISYFTLKDGTKVVKVYTDSGVHYIIVNKEYKKGKVEYEVGDDYWQSWEDTIRDDKLHTLYSGLSEEWKAKYHVDVDMKTILAKYAPAEEENSEGD